MNKLFGFQEQNTRSGGETGVKMEFKNRFWDRLFGSRPQKADEEAPAAQTVITDTEEAAPPLPDDYNQLELPDDHALHQLYLLWAKQAEEAPVPLLRLDGHEALSPDETEKELMRLQREVTTAAVSRLKETAPKKPEAPQKPTEATQEAENVQQEMAPTALDAKPLVFISADRLAAWLMVFPPSGAGKELQRNMLDDALAQSSVTFGVDTELLDRLPAEPHRYFHLFFAAKGTPVTHGEDGYIEDFYSRSVQQKFTVDEHDRVDYFNLNLVQNVEKGSVICQAVPPVAGIPGRTVRNEEIPCREGKAVALPQGQNTEISEDGSQLLAGMSGRLEFSGRTFRIKTLLEIDGNVDLSTGNINFMGDVHIRGDVCNGFSVRAMGDITIDGIVEAGVVESGGDLRVAKGILGDSRVVIRSRKNLYAKYMENCTVHVRENLFADYLANCDVYCDGEVQANTGKGKIIGGHIRAAGSVTAKTVGSRSENPTAISIGGRPCSEYERESLQYNVEELISELEKMSHQPTSPARTKQMNKLRLDLSVQKMKLARYDKELEEAEAAEEDTDVPDNCRLKCDIAHPGLVLTIHHETLRLSQETSCLNGRLVNGEIKVL